LCREWMSGEPGISNLLRFVSLCSPAGRHCSLYQCDKSSSCREVRS